MQSSQLVILVLLVASASVNGNHLIVSNRHQQHSRHLIRNPIVDIFAEGMELALKHCQLQFQHEPWNCPVKDFLAKQQQPTMDREGAFVQSITVAAVAYTLAKNCSKNTGTEKSSFCQCALRDKNGVKDIYDCFSNIEETENELTAQIINKLGGVQSTFDPQGVVLLQNTRAGLFVVMNSVQKTCRCHGFSGSCSISTCWMAFDSFGKIAADLKNIYVFAQPLDTQNSIGLEHVVLSDGEMTYLDESPNYCGSPKKSSGWESVRGRRCANSLSTEAERMACRDLCADCGLRMKWREVTATKSCNCKFNWCCNVTCDVCEESIKEFYCS